MPEEAEKPLHSNECKGFCCGAFGSFHYAAMGVPVWQRLLAVSLIGDLLLTMSLTTAMMAVMTVVAVVAIMMTVMAVVAVVAVVAIMTVMAVMTIVAVVTVKTVMAIKTVMTI